MGFAFLSSGAIIKFTIILLGLSLNINTILHVGQMSLVVIVALVVEMAMGLV